MPKERERVSTYVKLPRDQITRLSLLQKALEEKMGKEMSLSDILEKIIDEFLNSK